MNCYSGKYVKLVWVILATLQLLFLIPFSLVNT